MIKINSIIGGSSIEIKKLNQALDLLNSMWSSDRLKTLVTTHRFGSKFGYANTTDTTDEVWAKMQAKEVSINIIFYSPSFWRRFKNNVVGYEDKQGVHINRTFFDHYEPNDVAENLGHEALHALGYTHDFFATTRRPWSVPYAVGEMFWTLLKGNVWQ